MIDVWLSRMGNQFTAVDRTTTVIEKAKEIDHTGKVKFILDCPETAEFKNTWSKSFPMEVIRADSRFNEATRIQNIQFYFTPQTEDGNPKEEEFGIYD